MTSLVSRLGRAVWTAYEYVAMVLGLGALALLCLGWLPWALLGAVLPPRAGRFIGRVAIMVGFRLYLHFLTLFCACRFDLSALDSLRRDQPLIPVANHPSLLDVVMIVSRLPNAVCVMKASLMDNILLGAAARLARYIRNDAPVSMVRRARAALQQGAHLVIFPGRLAHAAFSGRCVHQRRRSDCQQRPGAAAGADHRIQLALPGQGLAPVPQANAAAAPAHPPGAPFRGPGPYPQLHRGAGGLLPSGDVHQRRRPGAPGNPNCESAAS